MVKNFKITAGTGVPRQNPQGGGFFFLASLRFFGLSKKNPTPLFSPQFKGWPRISKILDTLAFDNNHFLPLSCSNIVLPSDDSSGIFVTWKVVANDQFVGDQKFISCTSLTSTKLGLLIPTIDVIVRGILARFYFLSFSTRNFLFIFPRNKITKKAKLGVGFFFLASLSSNWRKKTPPPWGFWRGTPVVLPPKKTKT